MDKIYIVKVVDSYERLDIKGYTTLLSDAVKMVMNDDMGNRIEEIPFINPKDNSDVYIRYYALFDKNRNIIVHDIDSLDKMYSEYVTPRKVCFGDKVKLSFSIKASQLDSKEEIEKIAYIELYKA